MAERRHLTPMNLGYPGPLIYTPQTSIEDGPGLLEASRFTSSFPRFKIVGPLNTLYPPSKTQLPEASSRLWRERQVQERWLFRNRPEVFMGNTAFQDVLKEDLKHFRISEGVANDRPLLAVGHAPDLGVKNGTGVLPLMAVASGESGELLRLAVLEETQWQWGENSDAFLNMSAVNPANREADTTWASDGLPIQQLKWASERPQSETLRWLLVQKQTSTTILRPEYRHMLGTSSRPKNLSFEQPPSFIDPNPVLVVHQRQTGGRAHSDVAFIPTASARSPQLAIMDECGYWSLWDMAGAWQMRNDQARLTLNKCGHISDGLLKKPSSRSAHAAEKHGMILLGRADADDDDGTSLSRHLLMWNRERIEVMHLDSNIMLPKLGPLLLRNGKPDWILDIQCSPVKQGHVFILTKHHIIWVDVFNHNRSRRPPIRPAVLLTCAHLGTNEDDSRMFVCPASEEDAETSLVFIHYPQRRQICIFWFTFSEGRGIPQWHRDIISLPGSEEFHAGGSIQFLRVDPVDLAVSTKPGVSSPGITYHQQGARFYQLTVLGDDLSLRHCMCVVSTDPTLNIANPTTRVVWAEAKRQRNREKKRRLLMNHIASTFVLPDGMTMDDIERILQPSKKPRIEVQKPRQLKDNDSRGQPVRLKVNKLCRMLREYMTLSVDQGETGLPCDLFEALRKELDSAVDKGNLPLITWRQVADKLPHSGGYESVDNGMEQAVEDLLEENDEKTIITQLRRTGPQEPPGFLVGMPYLRRYFSELWLDPVRGVLTEEMQQVRQIWISQLAKDAFLSSYCIMVQDTPLLGPASSEMPESSSQGFPPRSQPVRSSWSSSRGIESSPARSTASAPNATDGAIQRLQLLAPSLRAKKLDVSKQSKVLSYWPTERGVDTSDYVSSIAAANEELFRDARERLQKMEAKRKARAEKYKRPAFMRQGLPDSSSGRRDDAAGRFPTRPPPVQQTMSSQVVPDSSQGHGPQTQGPYMPSSQSQGMFGPSVTMSQPMPGAFGDRKKAKKGKRKSGFR